jgi:hypothetical protein
MSGLRLDYPLTIAVADGWANLFEPAAVIGKGGSLVVTPDYTVTGSHREKPGQVEVRDKETDVIYIYMIEGDATFVTGGTMVGLHQTKAGQSLGIGYKGWRRAPSNQGRRVRGPGGCPALVQRSPPIFQLLRRQGNQAVTDHEGSLIGVVDRLV